MRKKISTHLFCFLLIGVGLYAQRTFAQEESLPDTVARLLVLVEELQTTIVELESRIQVLEGQPDSGSGMGEASSSEAPALEGKVIECDLSLSNPVGNEFSTVKVTEIEIFPSKTRLWYTVQNSAYSEREWMFEPQTRKDKTYLVDDNKTKYAYLDTNFPDSPIWIPGAGTYEFWVDYERPDLNSRLLTLFYFDANLQFKPTNWTDAQQEEAYGC